MAGAPGFEPGNGGIKIRCLTTWLRPIGRRIDRRGARTIAAGPRLINARSARLRSTPMRSAELSRPAWLPAVDRKGTGFRLGCADELARVGRRAAAPSAPCPPDSCRTAPNRRPSMSYQAPVADIAFALEHGAGFGRARADGVYGDLGEDVVAAVLEEAGKFATDVLAPLNVVGDHHGTPFKEGAITTPPGWKEAYRAWAQGGWNGLA